MIGRLHGLVLEKRPGLVLLEVSGVGYEVEIPYTTYFQLPATGAQTTLHTHLSVREDAHSLFGFTARRDRDLFRLLIKVSGVGPKLALGILSGLDAPQFARCIEQSDVAALVRLPGVGKKTAERLVIEMRDRIGQLEGLMPSSLPLEASTQSAPAGQSARDEAEAALLALGYKPAEASKAVGSVFKDGVSVEDMIRLALRGMLRTSG